MVRNIDYYEFKRYKEGSQFGAFVISIVLIVCAVVILGIEEDEFDDTENFNSALQGNISGDNNIDEVASIIRDMILVQTVVVTSKVSNG
jgi:hypothetical protein